MESMVKIHKKDVFMSGHKSHLKGDTSYNLQSIFSVLNRHLTFYGPIPLFFYVNGFNLRKLLHSKSRGSMLFEWIIKLKLAIINH